MDKNIGGNRNFKPTASKVVGWNLVGNTSNVTACNWLFSTIWPECRAADCSARLKATSAISVEDMAPVEKIKRKNPTIDKAMEDESKTFRVMHSLQICHSEGRMKRRLVMAEDGSLLWWWWRGIWMCCWFDWLILLWLCYVICVDLISKTIDGDKVIMTSIYYNGEWWTDTRRLLYQQNNTRNDTFSCLWWYDRNRVSCEWSFFLKLISSRSTIWNILQIKQKV